MTDTNTNTKTIYDRLKGAGWRDVPIPEVVIPESTPQRLTMLEDAITRYYEAQNKQVAGNIEYEAARYSRDPARHMRAEALRMEGRAAVYLAAVEIVTLGRALVREKVDALRVKLTVELGAASEVLVSPSEDTLPPEKPSNRGDP